VLPGLARATGGEAGPGAVRLVGSERLAPGLALLDSPDVDSVAGENRALAAQLLAAADAWLFVTTAARYADAVPWELLHAARERRTALSLVLNRVPPEARDEVTAHLAEMLVDRGLGGTQILVVPETALEDGLIPAAALSPVRGWLDGLAADAGSRAELVERTLAGALASLPGRAAAVEAAAAEQLAAAAGLRAEVERSYASALADVEEALRSGALLRGEVLARWHDVVGTGDFMRALEARMGRLRDGLRTLVAGRPAAEVELKAAVEAGIASIVYAAADRAAERAALAWRERVPGRALLVAAPRLDSASRDLRERIGDEVREWQGGVFELVRSEGAGRRRSARLASLGVNGAGLTVMLAVFVQTGGLTGAEAVIAGGTSAVGQKVLEAIFGDQAVRSLAARARTDLLERVGRLLEGEAARFRGLLEPAEPAPAELERLRGAVAALERAR
jgi:hypothetical protein